jgi:hypothetical protein
VLTARVKKLCRYPSSGIRAFKEGLQGDEKEADKKEPVTPDKPA